MDESASIRVSAGKFDVRVVHTIEEVHEEWHQFLAGANIFLSIGYLAALENNPTHATRYFYGLVSSQGRLCGLVYFQLKHFNAASSLNYTREDRTEGRKQEMRTAIRAHLANKIDFDALVCGNILLTGQNGFHFAEEILVSDVLMVVREIMDRLEREVIEQGHDVQLSFIKDFVSHKDRSARERSLDRHLYHEFRAQPNMLFHIPDTIKTEEDYLAALSSKYRVRARRARKKCDGVAKRFLSEQEVHKYADALYRLYRSISDKASFNLFTLHRGYVPALKRQLQERFQVCAYFDGAELVAFSSFMLDAGVMTAHFIGYEEEQNAQRQIYLNMLLDLIAAGIERSCKHIDFGRTALEIKSSVGAQPVDMSFYLRHRKGLQNLMLPKIYRLLTPRESWLPRRPFRKEQVTTSVRL